MADNLCLALDLVKYTVNPNPDKPERIATKPPRHKEKRIIIKKIVPWCLGGENLLLDKSFANMM